MHRIDALAAAAFGDESVPLCWLFCSYVPEWRVRWYEAQSTKATDTHILHVFLCVFFDSGNLLIDELSKQYCDAMMSWQMERCETTTMMTGLSLALSLLSNVHFWLMHVFSMENADVCLNRYSLAGLLDQIGKINCCQSNLIAFFLWISSDCLAHNVLEFQYIHAYSVAHTHTHTHIATHSSADPNEKWQWQFCKVSWIKWLYTKQKISCVVNWACVRILFVFVCGQNNTSRIQPLGQRQIRDTRNTTIKSLWWCSYIHLK